jgi:hypothetical protein
MQTIAVAISLFTVLSVGGGGKWKAAFRALVEHPWHVIFVGILLALFLRRRLAGDLDWSVILDVVLAVSILWAFNCVVVLFQARVLRRSHDDKNGPQGSS